MARCKAQQHGSNNPEQTVPSSKELKAIVEAGQRPFTLEVTADSPRYLSVRLFRQSAIGDWDDPLQ
jgi:hypothetical protein